MNRSFFFLLFFLIVYAVPGFAATDSPQVLAERLQARYEAAKTLSADFRQTSSVPMSGRKRLGTGTMHISKPGRIRWDYLAPEKQVLVGDGKKFSMYFAAANQMIVQPLSEYLNSDVTYAFFTGTGNIIRDFKILVAEKPGAGGLRAIKLLPKAPHPQVESLHIWFDAEYLPRRLEIVDHFGSITELLLSNIRINQPLAAGLFSFSPPPGTEIIEQ